MFHVIHGTGEKIVEIDVHVHIMRIGHVILVLIIMEIVLQYHIITIADLIKVLVLYTWACKTTLFLSSEIYVNP